jgi:hypothetical protein
MFYIEVWWNHDLFETDWKSCFCLWKNIGSKKRSTKEEKQPYIAGQYNMQHVFMEINKGCEDLCAVWKN